MHQTRRRLIALFIAIVLAALSLLALLSTGDQIRAIIEATLATRAALPAPTSTTPSTELLKRPPPVLFLQWSRYFGSGSQLFSERPASEFFASCESRCEMTNDRRRLDEARVLLFHMTDFDPRDLPPRRHAEQLYVFRNLESPALFPLPDNVPRGFFNATMTYRLDSDFPESYCSGPLGDVSVGRSGALIGGTQASAGRMTGAAFRIEIFRVDFFYVLTLKTR